MIKDILEDKRKIALIDGPDIYAAVGENGITDIVVYKEAGEMAYVPWLAVYKGREILFRLPARMVIIQYQQAAA